MIGNRRITDTSIRCIHNAFVDALQDELSMYDGFNGVDRDELEEMTPLLKAVEDYFKLSGKGSIEEIAAVLFPQTAKDSMEYGESLARIILNALYIIDWRRIREKYATAWEAYL